MTESTQQILQAALTLPPAERMRLIDRLVASLDRSDRDLDKPRSSQRDIMELKGLGKEIWQGIDAQEYVNQERVSMRLN